MYKINLSKDADRSLKRIFKGDYANAERIMLFLRLMANTDNPFALGEAKKMKGYKNRWRWRVGIHYRIVGIKQDDILTIEIIEISTRESVGY